jgi:hypothetical protein
MTAMIKKTVSVFVRQPSGLHFNPPRKTEKEVEVFDQDYGRHRKERQQQEREEREKNWRKLSPQQQLDSLDARGVNAKKQRARIQKEIESLNTNTKKKK